MWIARDQNGRLHLFYVKPKRAGSFWFNVGYNVFHTLTGNKGQVEIDDYLYPEVTFENSPKELTVKNDKRRTNLWRKWRRYCCQAM